MIFRGLVLRNVIYWRPPVPRIAYSLVRVTNRWFGSRLFTVVILVCCGSIYVSRILNEGIVHLQRSARCRSLEFVRRATIDSEYICVCWTGLEDDSGVVSAYVVFERASIRESWEAIFATLLFAK